MAQVSSGATGEVRASQLSVTPAGAVRPWLVLAFMLLTAVLYTVDRMVPVIIAEQIRLEFNLSDTQLGVFTGLLYGVSFCIFGLIFGPLIDRTNRTRLLAGMLMIWSGLTALAALATSYWQLVTLRFFVGAAEGGGSPTTLSILSDVFPPERRGTAIGIYKMGTPIGYFAASAGCGFVASHFGWRAAVLVAGVPGVLIALGMLRWVPDIPRGVYDKPVAATKSGLLGELVRVFLDVPGLALLVVGLYLFTFANLGVQTFLMPFLSRVHGMPLAEASFLFAVATGLGGFCPLLFGYLNDRVTGAGVHYSAWLAADLATASSLTGDGGPPLAASLIAWQVLVLGMPAVHFAAVITVTPPHVRGSVLAILLTGTIFVGMGLGPVTLGAISDYLGGGTAVREAGLALLGLNVLAIAMFAGAALHMARAHNA